METKGANSYLCLVEPEISVRMRNGDGVVFRSSQISQLTTNLVGERMSMDLSGDPEVECWRKDRKWNNWFHLTSFDNTDRDTDMQL